MILRRITKHVKDQNWFAVGLDFFIVVVGILIAFQITNWSEARSDRVREQQIIERLHSDFEALGQEVDEKIEFMEPLVSTIGEFQQLIIDGPKDTDLQALQNFYETAFSLPPISGQSDSYEQLVSSGDMNLLRNDQLREELVKHASVTRHYIHSDQARREWSRPYIPSIVRLRSLIEMMPMDEAFMQAGTKADFIVAIGMYESLFTDQLGVLKEHRESFTKITEMLAEESNK